MRAAIALLALAFAGPTAHGAQVPAPRADHHQHLFGPGTQGLAPSLKRVDAAQLIASLDEAGIGRAAILSVAYQFANPNRPPVPDEYARVRAENDWTAAEVARFPLRLRGICSVNPLRPWAAAELARCAANPNLSTGLKLHFGNSDVDLASPEHRARLREVFALANRQGMAIIVHLRANISRNRPYGRPQGEAFLRLLESAPDVTVQIAHLAGAGSFEDPRVAEALGVFVDALERSDPRVQRLFFDVSGVAGIGNWEQHRARVAERLRRIGMARILFGSDGTADVLRPRDAWTLFRRLPLSDEEFSQIAANVAPYLR
jgi:predicted TIM-barrel fold metal-dependent hydrolase